MESNSKESRDAARWLILAGVAALLLSFGLFQADQYLSGSPARDRAHANMMRELRIAQAQAPAKSSDDRLKVRILPPAPEVKAAGNSAAQSDHHH